MLTAYDIILRENILSLPINPSQLAKQNDVSIISYATLEKLGVKKIPVSKDGFSFVMNGIKIAYNGAIEPLERQRFTLIHELCHIWLGHLETPPANKDLAERQADSIASELLCPLLVLHLCGVTTPADIKDLCGVSQSAAQIAFKNLCKARKDKTLLKSEQEVLIATKFLPFISDYIIKISAKKQDLARYRNPDIIKGRF